MKRATTRWWVLMAVLAAAVAAGSASAPGDVPDMAGVPAAEPEAVGMSSARLERLDRVMQGYIDRDEVAGVVTLVARKGKVVHFSALGERDVEAGAPMTHDTIFRIASMTKPIASVALMMLYEEGRFQLRDPIASWLPEFADMQVAVPAPPQERLTGRYKTVPAARPITVQQVLTHTAGLANTYRGITQPEAARLLGLSQPDVSRLLRGDFREYSLERLFRLLNALGRDIDIVIRQPRSADGARLRIAAAEPV